MGVLIGMGSAGYVQKAVYKPNNFEVAIKVFITFLLIEPLILLDRQCFR